MSPYYGILTLASMGAAAALFYWVFRRRKHSWDSRNLMSQEESERILRILAASRNG